MSDFWQWQNDALWGGKAEDETKSLKLLANAKQHYAALKRLARTQPLTDIATAPAELETIRQHAAHLRQQASQLVVIGTGGASLGAHALCALAADPSRLRFLSNCDPVSLEAALMLPPEDTAWLIISKSGETVETLASALALIAQHQHRLEALQPRVRVITEQSESSLAALARTHQWVTLDHPKHLGGRFSVFSCVGLLPAAFAELDIHAIADSAHATLEHLLQQEDHDLLLHASWLTQTSMHVLMAYADALRPATQWHKQLMAESLGKNGLGITPITAIGAIDQHSQLQLYLDGPKDKRMTLWLPTPRESGPKLPAQAIDSLAYLYRHTMGDVMRATAEATVATLVNANVPLRVVRGALSPESLASWMARQMLEVLMTAHLLNVDPYSQPAVEAGKRLTRQALAGAAA